MLFLSEKFAREEPTQRPIQRYKDLKRFFFSNRHVFKKKRGQKTEKN
jgi:hypothetical protein